MALDDNGYVYSWGVPFACGLGARPNPITTPTRVETFPVAQIRKWCPPNSPQLDLPKSLIESTVPNQPAATEGAPPMVPPNTPLSGPALCRDISCGGGFSVVVLRSGKVCSWGMWAHGRLGLGPTPLSKTSSNYNSANSMSRRTGEHRKIARYQLYPAILRGFGGIRSSSTDSIGFIPRAQSVSCGESHTLLLTDNGEVYAWGQNSCGQVGVGPVLNGFLKDVTSPVALKPFNLMEKHDFVRVKSVSAGAFHSIAIDSSGEVWTWGARGTECIGQGMSPLSGLWGKRVNSIFSPSTNESKVCVFFPFIIIFQHLFLLKY